MAPVTVGAAGALALVAVALVSLRAALGRLVRVRIRGESMTPTLAPGDDVLVWRTRRQPCPGRLVVYRDRFDDRLRVKRVASVDADGTLRVRGDNEVLSTSTTDLGPVGPDAVVGVPILRRATGRPSHRLGYARLR